MAELRPVLEKIRPAAVRLLPLALFAAAALSVYAAFLGAERARTLFCSRPVLAFQISLAVLLLCSAFRFRPLSRGFGPMCIHAGAALVLLGNLWGADFPLSLRPVDPGRRSPSSGYMALCAGETKTALTADDLETPSGELPFGLRLESLRVESCGAENAGREAAPSCASEVTVLENGAETARKTIRINQPLYYRGYHIYQFSCDLEDRQEAVLYAKSARGLMLVCAGFVFLALGVVWRGWARPL